MEIDDKKIGQILGNLESAIGKIIRIDMWLPEAIDYAINGHRGTLDRADIDRATREKKEDNKIQIEIDSLRSQVEESQKQTQEIKKQTRYLLYAFIIAIFSFSLNAILQISPNLFGLLNTK
ncbi:MAG: hypothetical protein Q7S04_02925 [Candidatus Moranbacteria bacterium]|nr:hypothetical protein [Candidatus Moranbacteria bacterium]